MEFEKININDIKPAEYNPRIMKPSEQLKLKQGLETFGLVDPIILDLKHDNTIIGGHQRYTVIKEANPDLEFKLLRMGDIGLLFKETDFKLTDTNDQKALNIALNKISGEWDYGKLDDLLLELSEEHYNIELTGFDDDELLGDTNMFDSDIELFEEEFNDSTPDKTKTDVEDKIEDNTEEPYVPLKKVDTVIQEGDKYKLGSHILLCADSSKMENIRELIGEETIDLILTDPPYGINIVKKTIDGAKPATFEKSNGERSTRVVGTVPTPAFKEKQPHTPDNGIVGRSGVVKPRMYKEIIGDDKPYDPETLLELDCPSIIWGANNFSSKLPDSSKWIVWHKKPSLNGQRNTFSDCELAWTNLKGKTVDMYHYTWSGMTREGNRREELTERVHPTQKPVGLLKNIITTVFEDKNHNILDVYGGSGSTLIASEITGNNCYMIELDPYYCQIIINRWEEYTGLKAIKI